MKQFNLLLVILLVTVGCKDADPVANKETSDKKADTVRTDSEAPAETMEPGADATEEKSETKPEVAERTPTDVFRTLKSNSAKPEELLAFVEEFPGTDESFLALRDLARSQDLSAESKSKLMELTRTQFVENPEVEDSRAMEASMILLTAGGRENHGEVTSGMYDRFVKDADGFSPTVSQAISIIMQIGTADSKNKIITRLAENHADDPEVVPIVQQMERGIPGPEIEKFLTDLSEKSTNEKVQGVALITLAKMLASVPDLKTILSNEDFAASLPAETVSYIKDFNPADHAERITALLNRVSEDFADVDMGRGGTLGEIAEGELFVINNLSIGKVAPDIEGEDIAGEEFKLSDYRGKVVLLDFWGDW